MSEENILDKNKKYKILCYLYFPLKICPLYTLIIFINRVVTALIPAITVLVTADFIDKVIAYSRGGIEYQEVLVPVALYLTIIIYNNTNQTIIKNFISTRYDMKLTQKFSSAMIEKQACLKYKYIEDSDTWDLINRVCTEPSGKIAEGMNDLLDIIEMLVNVGSVLTIILSFAWWVAIVILIISVPLVLLAVKGGQEVYKENMEAKKYQRKADYFRNILIGRENVDERSLFGYSGYMNKQWHEKYEAARKIDLKVEMKYYIHMKAAGVFTVMISLLMIGLLVIPLAKKEIEIGMFIGLVTAVYNLVQVTACTLPYIAKGIAGDKEYLKDFNTFIALGEQEGALDLPERSGDIVIQTIEFQNVSFRYPNTDNYILNNFNLKIEKGFKYAFVGSNGAGKTTVIKLLTGLYDDYEGKILINGINIREYRNAQLKAFFSIVYQDYARYFLSVTDNILLGNVNNIKREKEENSKELFKIKNIIEQIGLNTLDSLPNGFDTYLGKIKKNGVDISGGQWQRLAIARALYSDAPIQVLDEPTASLDPVAESRLYELFGKISRNKTTIYVTHRLGAAKMADKIVVIENGRVEEFGTHKELIGLHGIYDKMFLSQKSWYEE